MATAATARCSTQARECACRTSADSSTTSVTTSCDRTWFHGPLKRKLQGSTPEMLTRIIPCNLERTTRKMLNGAGLNALIFPEKECNSLPFIHVSSISHLRRHLQLALLTESWFLRPYGDGKDMEGPCLSLYRFRRIATRIHWAPWPWQRSQWWKLQDHQSIFIGSLTKVDKGWILKPKVLLCNKITIDNLYNQCTRCAWLISNPWPFIRPSTILLAPRQGSLPSWLIWSIEWNVGGRRSSTRGQHASGADFRSTKIWPILQGWPYWP